MMPLLLHYMFCKTITSHIYLYEHAVINVSVKGPYQQIKSETIWISHWTTPFQRQSDCQEKSSVDEGLKTDCLCCPLLEYVYVPVWETKPLFHTDLQSDSIPDYQWHRNVALKSIPLPVPGHPHKLSLSGESGAWWSGFSFGNLSMSAEMSCHSLPFLNFSLPPTLLLLHHFSVNI